VKEASLNTNSKEFHHAQLRGTQVEAEAVEFVFARAGIGSACRLPNLRNAQIFHQIAQRVKSCSVQMPSAVPNVLKIAGEVAE
jgi:hypothetical protein